MPSLLLWQQYSLLKLISTIWLLDYKDLHLKTIFFPTLLFSVKCLAPILNVSCSLTPSPINERLLINGFGKPGAYVKTRKQRKSSPKRRKSSFSANFRDEIISNSQNRPFSQRFYSFSAF